MKMVQAVDTEAYNINTASKQKLEDTSKFKGWMTGSSPGLDYLT